MPEQEETGQEQAPKKGCLGCSFPLIIGILVVFLVLFVVGFASGPLGKSMLGDLGLPSWLSVGKPHPELPAERVFLNTGLLTNSIIAAWLTIIILVAFSYVATRRLKLIPTRLQSALESVFRWLLNFCQNVAGEKNGRRFFPVVATIFLFVIMNAWMGLLPGFGSITVPGFKLVKLVDDTWTWVPATVHLLRAANTDINMPLALALMSFAFVQYFGLRSLGGRYVGRFINVRPFFSSLGQLFRGKLRAGLSGLMTGIINIFLGFLEGLSELIHIISFTFRLFGNMTAGEILLVVAMFLVPWLFALPFYGLELLIGFIQALIFGGLTLVFLTIAIASHEAEAT